MNPESDEQRSDRLFDAVYERLKVIAGRQLSGSAVETMNPTGLVHELYIKMTLGADKLFESQAQFFDYAAKAMRHILIDRARWRLREKRGGDQQFVTLMTDNPEFADVTANRALEIDDALRKLEVEAPRAAKVVELHFFAGLQLDDIAKHLGVSTRTIDREWRFARAYLHSASTS